MGGRGAVMAWWGESRVGSRGAGRRVLELLMGSLGGHRGVLVEPSRIGRSLFRCISGRVCPVPDEVAAAACIFEFILGVSLYGAGLSFILSWRDFSFSWS